MNERKIKMVTTVIASLAVRLVFAAAAAICFDNYLVTHRTWVLAIGFFFAAICGRR